jgi:hypothetical protein
MLRIEEPRIDKLLVNKVVSRASGCGGTRVFDEQRNRAARRCFAARPANCGISHCMRHNRYAAQNVRTGLFESRVEIAE